MGQEKSYPPIDISVLLVQCRPHQLSVKFKNLVHSIFRNENSTLEINMSHFRVLHWQQWQPPASAPENLNLLILKAITNRIESLNKKDSSIQLDIRIFWPLGYFWNLGTKSQKEKLLKFTKILNYIKSLFIIFCVKMS